MNVLRIYHSFSIYSFTLLIHFYITISFYVGCCTVFRSKFHLKLLISQVSVVKLLFSIGFAINSTWWICAGQMKLDWALRKMQLTLINSAYCFTITWSPDCCSSGICWNIMQYRRKLKGEIQDSRLCSRTVNHSELSWEWLTTKIAMCLMANSSSHSSTEL